jgi:hypothetical protein
MWFCALVSIPTQRPLAQNQTLRYGLQSRNLSRFLGLILRYGLWCKTKSYIAEPKPAQWPIAQTKSCAMAHCADQILYGIRQQNVKISQHDTRFGSKTPPYSLPSLSCFKTDSAQWPLAGKEICTLVHGA